MDELEVNEKVRIPGWELWMTTSKSGGPGGQHANKSDTKVTIHWDVQNSTALSISERNRVIRRLKKRINDEGVLCLDVADTRSQHRNKDIARERLAAVVRGALTVKKRRIATRPTRASKRRRVENKRRRGEKKKLRKAPKKPLEE